MSAVVSAISGAVSGIVEAVGDVVDTVVDVVEDVGRSIDRYVIQPILDDPVTAIATMAGAAFLGPAIAPMLGTAFGAATGYVATGLGAAAANTTAGLAQGEDFDEALKGGIIAGVAAGATSAGMDYFSGSGAFAPDGGAAAAPSTSPDISSAEVYDFGDPFSSTGSGDFSVVDPMANPNVTSGAAPAASFTGTELPSLDAGASSAAGAQPSFSADPLGDYLSNIPGINDAYTFPSDVAAPSVITPELDYSLGGIDTPSIEGIRVPRIAPDAPIPTNYLTGDIDYSLMAGQQPIPFSGVQYPSAPIVDGMGLGQGVTVGVEGGTLGEYGFTPTPETFTTTPPAASKPSFSERLQSVEGLKSLGSDAMGYVMENPLTTLTGLTLLDSLSGAPGGPPGGPPNQGGTRDDNFNKRMELYNYLRDRQAYEDDIEKYGQTGGEFDFFKNTQFVPIPTPAAKGGLMQLRQKYAQGGMAQPMQGQPDPRMMAMMQQQGGQMPQRPPMPQGGLSQSGMGGRPMGRAPMAQGQLPNIPQGMSQNGPQGMQQGMQQRPQRMNRNPQTAYYQYGQPPAEPGQAQQKPMMNRGGPLNMVRSMNVGGGADGRSDDVDALLSDGEYVFDAETVAMLGNGSSEAGAKQLDNMRMQVRKHKGQNLSQGRISPDAKSPLQYLKG